MKTKILYAIDWDDKLDNCEYMLSIIDNEDIKQMTTDGVKSFLKSKLDKKELYHLTCGFWEDSPKDKIRLLTEEEAIESFPENEFILDYEDVS